VIHGCIYQARPDVHAVCHHHAIPVLPYCIAGIELVPVMHLGATLGGKVPFWDSRDEFGDTPLVVTKPEEGRSLARALGEHWMVLLRRHGGTVAGRSLRECVFRSVYTCRNAELQSRAMAMGSIGTLSAGEVAMCCGHSLSPRTIGRAWEYWTFRLPKLAPPPAAEPKRAKAAGTKRKAYARAAKRVAVRGGKRKRNVKRARKG
jgi:ribulose-5-phosphate 4-epimerase/fuculose-1-phosphate aldolase